MEYPESPLLPGYQIKSVELVYNPERIRVLIDETRKRILQILSEGVDSEGRILRDMSVAEIADKLETNPQRLYHHIDKLIEYNFILKTREERKKRSITSFYSRSAQAFIVSYTTERETEELEANLETFKSNFLGLLNVKLEKDELKKFEASIIQLTRLSSEIFSKFTAEVRDEENLATHVEHLYFLLEYFLFYTNPSARLILEDLTKLIFPKINTSVTNQTPTVTY